MCRVEFESQKGKMQADTHLKPSEKRVLQFLSTHAESTCFKNASAVVSFVVQIACKKHRKISTNRRISHTLKDAVSVYAVLLQDLHSEFAPRLEFWVLATTVLYCGSII